MNWQFTANASNTTDAAFNLWTNAATAVNTNVYRWQFDSGTVANNTNTAQWNSCNDTVRWTTVDVTTWIHSPSDGVAKKKRKEALKERWGVEKLPVSTPEELKEIERVSEEFLTDVLSPDELVMFNAENKVRVESGIEPEVHYIVKRVRLSRIERYVDGVLVETLGFHARWQELPELDILAAKVFDLKHNEAMVLKKSCRSAVAPRLRAG